ncbi:hypothetical protein [Mycobacterium palustre]|uniref:hypothetical protein n=1 Tax=Mycobacterium palustre TaxID=153971 RepID=UPI001B8077EB|nr:hypothetical protein [Mycobacterium palustre]
MTALHALVAAAVAGALIITGIGLLVGLAWALISAGVWITALVVLLYDPAASGPRKGARRDGFQVGP